jgi:NADPH:quinone reductase-like Zn-dependent oxidoreductase
VSELGGQYIVSKVVKFYEFGSPDVLKVEEEALRDPQPGEVRIKVQALGLNRADVLYRTNVYTEQAQFPPRIDYEASGIVDAIGEGVTEFRVGDRVSTIPGFSLNRYGVAGYDLTSAFSSHSIGRFIWVRQMEEAIAILAIPNSMTFRANTFLEKLLLRTFAIYKLQPEMV